MDDTFIIWPPHAESFVRFLLHLNSIRPLIQFTMEKEEDGILPFLDVLVYHNREEQ